MTPRHLSAADIAAELGVGLTYRQLSTVLDVNVGTLKRWRHEGMPASISSRTAVRFELPAVNAWIAMRRADPNALRRLRSVSFGRASVVYFAAAANGLIKIGFTSDVHRRESELGLEVLATLPGDKRIEALIQRAFAADHIEEEYFAPSPRLMAFVTALVRMQSRRAA